MIQVLNPQAKQPKPPSFLQSVIGGLAQGTGPAIQQYQQMKQQQAQQQKEAQALQRMGLGDLSGLSPELKKAALTQGLKGQQKQQEQGFLNEILNKGRGQGNAAQGTQPTGEGAPQIPENADVQELGKQKLPYSHEQIASAATINPSVAREMRAENDAVAREQRENLKAAEDFRKSSPEYKRESKLTESQAQEDTKYYSTLNEKRQKQVLKKESLARLKGINRKGVTGSVWDKLLESSGLTAKTSEGRREFSAEAKNQFNDFKQIVGSQMSAMEFFTLTNAYPNADFTKEANELIIQNLESMHDTLDKEYEIALKLKKENKGKPPEYVQEKVNEELGKHISKKIEKIKENTQEIMRLQYGIQPGFQLMFDPEDDSALSVPDDKVAELLDNGQAYLP